MNWFTVTAGDALIFGTVIFLDHRFGLIGAAAYFGFRATVRGALFHGYKRGKAAR